MSDIKTIVLNGTSYSVSGGTGLTEEVKTALLQLASKVAYIDEDGQDYYDALETALYSNVQVTSISATFTQPSINVYDDWALNDLKPYLSVIAHYDNGTSQAVTTYTLSGTLVVGTSPITVIYDGKTTSVNVTVSSPLYAFSIGTHVFTNPASTVEVYSANSARVICSTANNNDTHANVSKYNDNTTACNTTDNYDSTIPFFTVPAGSTVRARVKINSLNSVSNTTSGSTSLRGLLAIAGNSQIKAGVSDGTVFENSITVAEDTPVPSVALFFGGRHGNTEASIDVSYYIYVDDVRYV